MFITLRIFCKARKKKLRTAYSLLYGKLSFKSSLVRFKVTSHLQMQKKSSFLLFDLTDFKHFT